MSGWSGTIKGSGVELEHQLGSGDETTCHMCRSSDTPIFDLGTKPLVICAASAPDTTLFECVAPSPCLFLPNWSPALSRGGRYVVGKIDTDSYLHLHVYICDANLYFLCIFFFKAYLDIKQRLLMKQMCLHIIPIANIIANSIGFHQ